jgi:hypothetical protein
MMAGLFTHPVLLPAGDVLWLVLPLCVAVALVYKAIRAPSMGRFWLQSLWLIVLMAGGLAALGVALWLVYTIATR